MPQTETDTRSEAAAPATTAPMAAIPWPHPIIAREGWPFIAIALVMALLASKALPFFWGAVWFWLLLAFVAQFFRDPPREGCTDPSAVLSPADGRIVKVQRVRDPYAERDALLVSVFMNVFNVHSNRAPVEGEVQQARYFPGSFLNADLDKASIENERNALVIRRADGALVTCVQVAGLIARRILCAVREGQKLARGQRYGFIRFGSRVDVYLPPEARVAVAPGEKVKASASVLAWL